MVDRRIWVKECKKYRDWEMNSVGDDKMEMRLEWGDKMMDTT